MDKGAKVYRGFVASTSLNSKGEPLAWVVEATVTGVVHDGKPVIDEGHGRLSVMGDNWRRTKAEAITDIHCEIIRLIGMMQAAADRWDDQRLHVSLTAPEATP